jgi:hypothetical protein
MSENKDLSVTTFNTVVVEKTKLLETLRSNRDKHNSIFDAAVSGYWLEAQKVVERKKEQFTEAVSKVTKAFATQTERLEVDFSRQYTDMQANVAAQNKDKMFGVFSVNHSLSFGLEFTPAWPLTYPENHLEDYDRVIDLLDFSVADKVELSSSDFDAYVRNNWSWRKSFLNTNTSYVGNYLSGCMGTFISASGLNSYALTTTGCGIGGIAFSGYNPTYVSNTLNQGF